MAENTKPRVAIIPGMGCTPIAKANWYIWVQKKLSGLGLECVCTDMPDPHECKESIWLPYMEKDLGCDENTIVIGHSSGSEAIMRYLETHKVRGAILVSACHTDLGSPSEKISGYYDRPWQWEKIKANAGFIVQYGSRDDRFIPIAEQRHVAKNLDAQYLEFKDRGHFMTKKFPDLVDMVASKVGPAHLQMPPP